MTPLQQTALDFAREVLGYSSAKLRPYGEIELSFTPPRGFNDFRYTDLNAVTEAVERWADAQPGVFLFVERHRGRWHVIVNQRIDGHDHRSLSSALMDGLGDALLTASVSANRQLKGITHD